MQDIAIYHQTGVAAAAAAFILFLSLLVADVAGVIAKKTPGDIAKADHSSFLFRSNRALGNMNESIAIFIIFALIGILSGADAKWLAYFAWVYVGARFAYLFCYWLNIKLVRSLCFGISLIGLGGMGYVMVRGFL
ncbi:MAG: MAPEG family protein [Robiginitomaculum sp.]|nr:MAPEG family protein [Robiginitomaculum sp.]